MNIKNREELAKLINNFAVETYPGESKPGRKMMNTIIYNKRKDKFYRIEWGEIANEDQVNFLWYNENAKEVFLNPKGHEGWFTKDEIKELMLKEGDNNMNLEELLLNVENNVITVNTEGKTGENLENIEVIGAKTGKGKTWYAVMQAVEAMVKKESVLFFSTEMSAKEVEQRIKKVIMETRISNEIWTDFEKKNKEEKEKLTNEFIKNSDVMVIANNNIDTNYIISEMRAVANSSKLDFVAVDNLQMSLDCETRNTIEIQKILDCLEDIADELKCRIVVTTQINNNF